MGEGSSSRKEGEKFVGPGRESRRTDVEGWGDERPNDRRRGGKTLGNRGKGFRYFAWHGTDRIGATKSRETIMK